VFPGDRPIAACTPRRVIFCSNQISDDRRHLHRAGRTPLTSSQIESERQSSKSQPARGVGCCSAATSFRASPRAA
jgi:hypothetical protein